MIGRKMEQSILEACLQSPRPEFLAVYGRRRVGKTYLIREFFHTRFAFYTTGVAEGKTRDQLRAFHESLKGKGCAYSTPPRDWFEAFSRMRELVEESSVQRDPVTGKRVIFLDELPWMDTARSDFKPALDYFWNSWGSAQSDLLLIVCGSAASWMMRNLLTDTGGFYRRVTRQIHLAPFSLRECEALFAENQFVAPRKMLLESYMIFGGIPFYLNQLDRRMSLAQNVNQLCFQESGALRHEYQLLFKSLFRNPKKHLLILEKLAEHRNGLTRVELSENPSIGNGEALTEALNELEQCGFIRKFSNFAKQKQGHLYQVIDPFTLFSLRFLQDQPFSSWLEYIRTPGYYSWMGNAFETVCLHHIPQIKQALGIPGISSMEYSWKSVQKKNGAQIDLLIDRQDQMINLCEMKYTQEPYTVTEAYSKQLQHKLSLFQQETGTDKAIHLTLVSAAGVDKNTYSGEIQNIITADDLFA